MKETEREKIGKRERERERCNLIKLIASFSGAADTFFMSEHNNHVA